MKKTSRNFMLLFHQHCEFINKYLYSLQYTLYPFRSSYLNTCTNSNQIELKKDSKCRNILFLSNVSHLYLSGLKNLKDEIDSIVDNLHSTNNGEPCQESHSSSNS